VVNPRLRNNIAAGHGLRKRDTRGKVKAFASEDDPVMASDGIPDIQRSGVVEYFR